MKIGIISDTHIPKNAKSLPKEIFNIFKDVDMIIHAGDITDLSVLDELKTITSNVVAVAGNMDPAINQTVLPVKTMINISDCKIGIMHGWGAPFGLKNRIRKEFKDQKLDIIIYGHSHNHDSTTENGILFINPGSATDKLFNENSTVAILEINNNIKNVKFIKL